MPQVRCPLCSYLNPSEAEVCSFCGARLKPLQPSSGENADVPAGETKPEDENDWLRSLQSDQGEPDASAEEPQSDEDMPEWLSRIRSKAQNDVGDEDEQVDWMQELSGEEEPSEESSADDWLSRLESPSDAEPSSQPSPQEPVDDLPDWLQGASEDSETPTPGSGLSFEPSQTSDEEDFSWLGGEAQPEQPAESNTGFGLTGFLSSIESESEPETGASDAGETPSFEDSSEAGLPDWLSAEADTPSSGAEAEAAGEDAGTELPDWLSGAAFQSAEEETPQPASEPSEMTPDWLSELGESADAQEIPAGEEVEQPGADDASGLPAWMTAGEDMPAAEEPPAVEETAPTGETLESEGLPDWMTAFEAPAPEQPEPPDIPEPAPLSADELPDFTSLASSSSDLEEDSAVSGLAEEIGATQEEVPDWLRGFDAEETTDAEVPPLFGVEGAVEPAAAGQEDQPFAVDLPDWLSEETPGETGQDLPESTEPVTEELAQAELPDWVKEMRPIESIIPGEADLAEIEHRAEKVGPLAGLAGILPAEELAARYQRPPVYSAKLRVSEKQRGQATQFENLISQETQPLLIPTRARSTQGGWLRVLIALLLIIVLALPPLVALEPLAVPTLSPDETMRMFDHIEGGLSVDSPVLLAVDFDPALWGEMKLASQPVIDHLMAREARIVIVSTRPTGPALAALLLRDAVAVRVGYNLEEKTENLGYLPGDMISLLEFAHQPAFAAPANLAGELAWQRSTLRGIATMQDFSSVVVLTDTAETGRAWVEQVQPEMGDVPLLMVTSAQAAPMMAPFVESGQVDGMVSGLLGGVLYSQWTRQEGPGQAYLASYQVGVLLALALALGGGLISGAVALLNRGKDED